MRIEDIANPLISDPEQVGADNFQKLFSAIPQTAQQVATDKPQDLTRTISLNLKDIGQLDYQEQQDKKDRDKPDDAVSTYLQTIGLAGGIANAPVKLQTVTPNIASYSTTSKPVQVASLTNIGATDAATGVATGVSGTDLLSTDAFAPKLTDIDDPIVSPDTVATAEKSIDLLSGEKADDLITKGLSKIGVGNQPFTSVGSYQFPGYTATSSYTAPNMGMVPKNQYVATTATGQLAATGSAALGAIGAAQALKGGIDSPQEALQFGTGTLTTLAGLQTAGIMGGSQFAALMANPYVAIALTAATILGGSGIFGGKGKPPMGGVEFRLVDDAGKQHAYAQEGQKRRIKAVNPHSYNGFNSSALLSQANKNVDYLYAFADEFGLKVNESVWSQAAFGGEGVDKYMPRGRQAPYRSVLERIDSAGDGSRSPGEWLRHALEYEGPNGERIVEGDIYKGLRIVNGQPVRTGYKSQEEFQQAVDKFNKQFFA